MKLSRSMAVWLCLVPGAWSSLADRVSVPKRLFGLGEVGLIAVSPEVRFLATAGQGGAFLWDAQNATLKQRLATDWSVTALAFSPTSNLLAVASQGRVMAWDVEAGVVVREFAGHRGEIGRLRFSADGKRLVSASADNTARVWSVESGMEEHSVRTPGSAVLDVALSPDGQTLATIDTFLTNCVKLWDLASETQLRALPKTNWTAERCLFVAGGLVVTGPDRSVVLWDPATAAPIRSYSGVTGSLTLVMDLWMPNEHTLGAACNDGSVYLWGIENGTLTRRVAGEPALAAIGVPGEFLTIGAQYDRNVRIRQLPGGDTLRMFQGHTTSTHVGVAFAPNGRYVLSGGIESATRLWERQTGKAMREFMGSPAGTMAAAFSPDGSRVLTTVGLPNPGARLWNTETGGLEREFNWTGSWPSSAVFSWDGTKLATRSQGEAIRLFDAASGVLIGTLPSFAFSGPVAFAPQAPLLAAGATESGVDLFNYQSGQLLHTFVADAGAVKAVAFSPGGDTLMVAWEEGLIRLYNAFTLEMRREFPTAAAFLECAAFSPEGRHILTGEGWPLFTATLWDAETAQPLRTFAGHKWNVSAVAFSPDGASILTGAELVREWSIADVTARLGLEKLAHELRLTWSLGELQSAPQPQGPWQTLTNATSPWSVPVTDPARFYRVRVVENL